VEFYHWRLLEDGSVLYVRFSAPFDDLKPENEEAVRGWTTIFGYFLRPTDDGAGTDVHMIFDVSYIYSLDCRILLNRCPLHHCGVLRTHSHRLGESCRP
jgi:hypothetical protein